MEDAHPTVIRGRFAEQPTEETAVGAALAGGALVPTPTREQLVEARNRFMAEVRRQGAIPRAA